MKKRNEASLNKIDELSRKMFELMEQMDIHNYEYTFLSPTRKFTVVSKAEEFEGREN